MDPCKVSLAWLIVALQNCSLSAVNGPNSNVSWDVLLSGMSPFGSCPDEMDKTPEALRLILCHGASGCPKTALPVVW
jgi:hypothetical protein